MEIKKTEDTKWTNPYEPGMHILRFQEGERWKNERCNDCYHYERQSFESPRGRCLQSPPHGDAGFPIVHYNDRCSFFQREWVCLSECSEQEIERLRKAFPEQSGEFEI